MNPVPPILEHGFSGIYCMNFDSRWVIHFELSFHLFICNHICVLSLPAGGKSFWNDKHISLSQAIHNSNRYLLHISYELGKVDLLAHSFNPVDCMLSWQNIILNSWSVQMPPESLEGWHRINKCVSSPTRWILLGQVLPVEFEEILRDRRCVCFSKFLSS